MMDERRIFISSLVIKLDRKKKIKFSKERSKNSDPILRQKNVKEGAERSLYERKLKTVK